MAMSYTIFDSSYNIITPNCRMQSIFLCFVRGAGFGLVREESPLVGHARDVVAVDKK